LNDRTVEDLSRCGDLIYDYTGYESAITLGLPLISSEETKVYVAYLLPVAAPLFVFFA